MKKHQNRNKGKFAKVGKFKYAFRIVILIILALAIVKGANMVIDIMQTKEAHAEELSLSERLRTYELNEKLSVEQARQEARKTALYGSVEDKVKVLSLSNAEKELLMKESSLNFVAKNPKSTAFGVWQGLHSTRVKYAKKVGVNHDTIEPQEQIAMFRAYVSDRYQTADQALSFWLIHHYY